MVPSDLLEHCRLCLVKECVSVNIFENDSEIRQLYYKIVATLPVEVRIVSYRTYRLQSSQWPILKNIQWLLCTYRVACNSEVGGELSIRQILI